MASVFKSDGAEKYTILYTDENGKRRKRAGYTDKKRSDRLANDLQERAREIRDGLADPKAEAYRDHAARPLADHLADWTNALEAKNNTTTHVELFTARAKRVVALLAGAKLCEIDPPKCTKHKDLPGFESALAKATASVRLSDLTAERVQQALATLKTEGRSLATLNHHRAAVKSFAAWCYDTHRTRENSLRRVAGFNAKEDRRHDRRTISLEELQQLIAVAEQGPTFMGMTGRARALCYRLAVATGLRYSEIASIRPESFDWDAPSVTVAAAYTKNGDPATLPIPEELVSDLAAYVAPLNPKMPVFPLPAQKGAKLLRLDLKAAKIPYRDAGDLVFDFHSLRCEMATLADAAGVSPRVVQKMMRHSTLELTGRYTRPRAVDIEAAASKLPSLKPDSSAPEAAVMTGTDPGPVLGLATLDATLELSDGRKSNAGEMVMASADRIRSPRLYPLSYGRDFH